MIRGISSHVARNALALTSYMALKQVLLQRYCVWTQRTLSTACLSMKTETSVAFFRPIFLRILQPQRHQSAFLFSFSLQLATSKLGVCVGRLEGFQSRHICLRHPQNPEVKKIMKKVHFRSTNSTGFFLEPARAREKPTDQVVNTRELKENVL